MIAGAAGLSAQTATQLVITSGSLAGSYRANQTFNVTVAAQDSSNVTDTTWSTDFTAVLSANPLQLSASPGNPTTPSSGEVIFTFSVAQIGTGYTLTFSSGALTTAISTSFNITADRLVITQQPTTVKVGTSIAPDILVEARDGLGTVDTSFTGSVSAAVATGSGATGGTTSVNAVAGEATFSALTVSTVGSKTLGFTATNLTTATSNSFNVTADRLIITAGPTTTVAGASISTITVEAQDGSGNTDTTFTGSVAVTLTTGSGTLSGTTPVNAVLGAADFSNLSINLIGTDKELTFSFAGLTSAISSAFTINPASDSAVRFVQEPSNAQTGVAISPAITVEIVDQFGNRTSSSANVSLVIGTNPGGSTLSGGGATAASAGLATFAGVSLNNAGTGYTLVASSGALTNDTSATFDITATPTPTITVTGTLTAFNTTGVSVPSAQQSYTVAGANLAANITVTPPSHFEISLTGGGGFAATNPITLTPAGGTVASTTIFVRYNPSNTSSPHTGNITHASSSATTQNQACSGSITAPAAGSMAASPSNPGVQSANPGTSRTALVFRVTETGGGTAYTVTGLSATVATVNNTAGVAIARISSVSFVRGSTVLGTVTNGGTGWSAVGDNVTVSLSGLSNNITAGTSADYALAISFTGASVPVPNPRYTASIQTAGVTGSAVLSGTAVTGGQITLIESLPDDPFADDDDEEGCDLSTRGGPAWPAAVAVLLLALLAAVRVTHRARN
ncbi:MAG: hypothetical protein IT463_12285 [Planctomycetes bacterium]|nr:hypothetical protein [Planctomycetota bacterium]